MKNLRYRVVIVDDETPARRLLEEYDSVIPELKLTGSFNHAAQAAQYLEEHTADILLCDIQMPQMSGIELVRQLKKPVCVIFTTAHSRFAVEGFEVDAADYLLKPIELSRFRKAIDKAREICDRTRQASESIYVKSDYKIHKIDLPELIYMESQHEYVTYYTRNKRITAFGSLKALEQTLPRDRFLRIHKSYIISKDKIVSITRNSVILNDMEPVKIPVGRVYRESLAAIYAHPSAGRES